MKDKTYVIITTIKSYYLLNVKENKSEFTELTADQFLH